MPSATHYLREGDIMKAKPKHFIPRPDGSGNVGQHPVIVLTSPDPQGYVLVAPMSHNHPEGTPTTSASRYGLPVDPVKGESRVNIGHPKVIHQDNLRANKPHATMSYQDYLSLKTDISVILFMEVPDIIEFTGDDVDKVFVEAEWINVGRIWLDSEIPTCVVIAKTTALQVPPEFLRHAQLPAKTLPVSDFTEFPLLHISSEIVVTKPKIWFSDHEATTSTDVLLSRPAPSKDFLEKLEGLAGQAWLNGTKSIIDWRFNNGKDHLPLWSISFWRIIITYADHQTTWRNSIGWLDTQEKIVPNVSMEIKQTRKELDKLGWATQMKFCRRETSTLQLSRFLGTLWLSDDHVNMMMEELSQDLAADNRFQVATTWFSTEIHSVERKQKQSKTLMKRYEIQVREKKLDKLFFPVHIHGNHWIAGMLDFKQKTINFGDSQANRQTGGPRKFVQCLQKWLRSAFGCSFKNEGNSLPHAFQDDGYSCGIITANTIAHAIGPTPLWTKDNAVKERLSIFLRLAVSDPQSQHARPHTSAYFENEPGRDHIALTDLLNPTPRRIALADLLNPTPSLPYPSSSVAEAAPVYASDTDEDDEAMSDFIPSDDEERDTPILNDATMGPEAKDRTEFRKRKRADSNTDDGYATDQSDSFKRRRQVGLPLAVLPGEGTSKSAIVAREKREQVRTGTFIKNPRCYERWRKKILESDPKAEFSEQNIQYARHSTCGRAIYMKEPYNMARWTEHIKRGCKKLLAGRLKAADTPTLSMMGWTAKTKKPAPLPSTQVVPCPGLSELDDGRVARYLKRTPVLGGGGRSLARISIAFFKKTFSKLKPKLKKQVLDSYSSEWKWRNEFASGRVFSTICQQQVADKSPSRPQPCVECHAVLTSKPFKNTLAKRPSKPKNYKYTNIRYRNTKIAQIFARTVGLKEIFEVEDPKSNPFIKYATGALSGKYNNGVFNALIEVMVKKEDREEKGVGLQNFKYPPLWQDMCHIIRIQSAKAYASLKQHLPMPDERTLRKDEAKQPRFPMEICDRSFQLVAEHLATLDLGPDIPFGLSSDDSKLFSTYRLYQNNEDNAYYLVGGIEGPLRVLDPENIKAVIASASSKKATKLRLWCLTPPIPKISPIIIAALPIGADLDAITLVNLLQKVVDGLIDVGVRIVSYACDGTEVERAVQRLFLDKTQKKTYTIKNPRPGCPDTVITYGIYRKLAICIIQDSKHGLKSFRNNLFSGARLLTFGNFTAMYCRILELALGEGTPLFRRDVLKLDRQDDSAATRLFSADVLKYLIDHFPDNIFEILYLFIFGELIDAYQNRHISHAERVKMVLRARYFVESWEHFLLSSGYSKTKYCISREALDITRMIIEGFLALLIIHRDHLPSVSAFLPWLHSSESCEHVFGEARQVVKDFTFLDFIYMVPKLRIKLHEAALRGKASNPKARAAGYSHTYFDSTGLDLLTLSTFPSNSEIATLADCAAEEVNSLISLLGIVPDQLHRRHIVPIVLPSIDSWSLGIGTYYHDSDSGDDEDCDYTDTDDEGDANALQSILDAEEDSPFNRSHKTDEKVMALTSAALALSAHDMLELDKFLDTNEDVMDNVVEQEYAQASELKRIYSSLPALDLNTPDEAARPFGFEAIASDSLDFNILVDIRRQHQTNQAASGVRTRKTAASTTATLRKDLARDLHRALAEAQDEQAVGTGLERQARWRAPAPGGRDGLVNGVLPTQLAAGTSANAAEAAQSVAKKAASRRKLVFTKATVPRLPDLINARVTAFRPLQVKDFGFAILPQGLMIAQVMAIYSKTGGKNGKHAHVTESSSISAISYLAVQLFERRLGRQFTPITSVTAPLQTKQFGLIAPMEFLCLLGDDVRVLLGNNIELSDADNSRFHELKAAESKLFQAETLFRKRGILEDDNEG